MADYMHACPACHAFYTPNVAASIHKGTCPCGASLEKTNITVEAYGSMGDVAARKAFYRDGPAPEKPKAAAPVEPAAPAVQYRKKQPPEEFDVDPQQLPTSGCLAYFAILGVPTVAIFAFLQNELDLRYLVGGLCLSLFLFAVARISAHLANVVRHLGAIRWLMQHGDETEPVPAPQPQPETNDSNAGLWICAGVLLLLVVLIVIYIVKNG